MPSTEQPTNTNLTNPNEQSDSNNDELRSPESSSEGLPKSSSEEEVQKKKNAGASSDRGGKEENQKDGGGVVGAVIGAVIGVVSAALKLVTTVLNAITKFIQKVASSFGDDEKEEDKEKEGGKKGLIGFLKDLFGVGKNSEKTTQQTTTVSPIGDKIGDQENTKGSSKDVFQGLDEKTLKQFQTMANSIIDLAKPFVGEKMAKDARGMLDNFMSRGRGDKSSQAAKDNVSDGQEQSPNNSQDPSLKDGGAKDEAKEKNPLLGALEKMVDAVADKKDPALLDQCKGILDGAVKENADLKDLTKGMSDKLDAAKGDIAKESQAEKAPTAEGTKPSIENLVGGVLDNLRNSDSIQRPSSVMDEGDNDRDQAPAKDLPKDVGQGKGAGR